MLILQTLSLLFLLLSTQISANSGCTVTKTRTVRFVYYSQTTQYDTSTVTVTKSGTGGTQILTSVVTSKQTVTVTASNSTSTNTITRTMWINAPNVSTVTSIMTISGQVATVEVQTTITTDPVSTVNMATINGASAITGNMKVTFPVSALLMIAAFFFFV